MYCLAVGVSEIEGSSWWRARHAIDDWIDPRRLMGTSVCTGRENRRRARVLRNPPAMFDLLMCALWKGAKGGMRGHQGAAAQAPDEGHLTTSIFPDVHEGDVIPGGHAHTRVHFVAEK